MSNRNKERRAGERRMRRQRKQSSKAISRLRFIVRAGAPIEWRSENAPEWSPFKTTKRNVFSTLVARNGERFHFRRDGYEVRVDRSNVRIVAR